MKEHKNSIKREYKAFFFLISTICHFIFDLQKPNSLDANVDTCIHSPDLFRLFPCQISKSIIYLMVALIESNLSCDIPQFIRLLKVIEAV
jgi:hypothetical protein